MKNLEQLISRIHPMSQGAKEAFVSKFKEAQHLKKKEFLIKEGQLVDGLYYVASGVLRAYYEKDGEEVTFNFYFGPTIFTDFISVYEKTPSKMNVVVLEDCEVYYANMKEMEQLAEKDVDITQLFLKFFQILYLYNHKRQLSMIYNTPEERYLELLELRPKVFQQMPLKYIATYLGVKPETLSRLRAQMYRPKD